MSGDQAVGLSPARLDLGVLRRGWWVGVLVFCGTLVAAERLTSRQTPVYRATMKIVVGPDPRIAETQEILRTLEALERRTILATFAELAQSPDVRTRAAELMAVDESELGAFRVSAGIVPNTNVMRVATEGPTGPGVAGLADAIATAVGEEAQRLYAPFAVRPLTRATPPTRPALPDPRRNLLVAGVVGVFFGLGLAYLFGRALPPKSRAPVVESAPAHAAT
jgi:uncharacterized protein involved in exopolysaccharide biosynthesis